MKHIERLNHIGRAFIEILDPNTRPETLTQNQVSFILSLQEGLEEHNGDWYYTHFPHAQFGNLAKPTTSKLLIGKVRKTFLKLS